MKRQLMMAAAAALLFASPGFAQTTTGTTGTTNNTTGTTTNDTTTTTTGTTNSGGSGSTATTATTAAPMDNQAVLDQMSKVTAAQDFVNDAAMSDMFEIKSAQMAKKQAGNKDVKKFASMLIADHTKADKELLKLAKAAKVDFTKPKQLDERHQQILDSMKDAKGDSFDTAFLQAQVQAHQEGVALFQSFSQNGDNPKLKAFAKKGLPTLQKHLDEAQKLSGGSTSQTQPQTQ